MFRTFRLNSYSWSLPGWQAAVMVSLAAVVPAGCDHPKASNTDQPAARQALRDKDSHGPVADPAPGSETISDVSAEWPGSDASRDGDVAYHPQDGKAGDFFPQSLKPPQTIYRADDARPSHDDARLAEIGILKFESPRLKLYSDVDPDVCRLLPALIDQVYAAWVNYFGPLPPSRDRSEYQMAGYLMADKVLFERAGLLPDDLPPFVHGRHLADEFWIHEQETGYYRRHLMIHEATHCFMTTLPDGGAPVWYMEGMAELFGTHVIDADGSARFRVMPHNEENFLGFGRLRMIRESVGAGRSISLDDVTELGLDDFSKNESYAWSWALCKFLDAHPRFRERFRLLGRQLREIVFTDTFQETFRDDLRDMRTEWLLFTANLEHGYDLERAAIDFRAGSPISDETAEATTEVVADRGWQSSGVLVEQGTQYDIAAAGQYVLGQVPRPWVSEPQGISIYYSQGRPIGKLLATIRASAETGEAAGESMLYVIPVGRHLRLTAPLSGTLYLRINDFWSSLADNSGQATVRIRAAARNGEE